MSELREAFVLARFAERGVFGREDIEAWLEHCTRETREPWTAPAYLARLRYWSQASRTTNHLDQYASSFSFVPPGFWIGTRRWMVNTLRAFHASGRDVYYGLERDRFAVVVCGVDVSVIEVKDPDGDALNLRSATTDDIRRVIFAEWVLERPKAQVALNQWLAPSYKQAIANVRESAQRDFDEAVAVSADGTKIVKAKWVLVCGRTPEWDRRGYLLRGEIFRAHKCRLRNGYSFKVDLEFLKDIRDFGVGFTTEDLFRGRVACYGGNSHIFDFHYLRESQRVFHGKLDSLLVIDESFCPSPLPDGGREIRV